jgi:hypothetical protein
MWAAFIRAVAGVSFLVAPVTTSAAQVLEVEGFRVQLFNQQTGKLSDDISGEGIVWNALIGQAQADAFLLTVIVKGKPQSADRTTVVTVTILDHRSGRTLLQRRFRNFLFEDDGRSCKPMLVEGRTCSPTRILGRVKSNVKTLVMKLECGE